MKRHVPRILVGLLACSVSMALAADGELQEPVAASGMSIQLPAGWVSEEAPSGRTVLLARAAQKDKDDTGELATTLAVSTGPATKPEAKAILAAIKNDYPSFRLTEEAKDVQFKGAAGIQLGGTLQSGATRLQMRQYVLTDGKKGFIVTVIALQSRWEKYLPAIDASVATFSIQSPEGPSAKQ